MTYSSNRACITILLTLTLAIGGCFSYGFTGGSIPPDVNSIFIPFFPDQSNSGLGDLSNRLNRALIDRFINQSKLNLASNREGADVVLDGTITQYSNRPFSVTGDEESDLNEVTITVRASFQYTDAEQAEWNRSFSSSFRFDPNVNPIEGENTAADDALETIAQNMFNESIGKW